MLSKHLGRCTVPLSVALLALIFSRSIDQTIYYRLAESYTNYVWYLGAIILPLAFMLLSWIVVWFKLCFTDDISDDMRDFPQHKYAIMALFDTTFNLLSTWPIYPLGGTVANVLSQLVLPFNMMASMMFLGTRYRKVHYIGGFLAVYGVLVRFIPSFQGASDSSASGWTYTGFVIMLVGAQIPAALSNVYKEYALKGYDMDVWYMNAWISVWQVLWGLLTIPTVALPFSPSVMPLSELPEYFVRANKCFVGVNSLPSDNCNGDNLPILVFLVFICFNLAYNQLMLYVFKHGSSVLFVIASAVRLPLVDLLLLSSFIAGSAVNVFTLFDGFALVALILAIVVYYSEREERPAEPGSASVSRTPAMMSPKLNPSRALQYLRQGRRAKSVTEADVDSRLLP